MAEIKEIQDEYKGKDWLPYEKQLEKYIERGMTIDDCARAEKYLSHIGYYRLSGYTYSFRANKYNDQLKDGTSFDHIRRLYVFDRMLRSLVSEGIERIEISLRANYSYVIGGVSPWLYNLKLKPNKFIFHINNKNREGIHNWIESSNERVTNSRGVGFIRHNLSNHGEMLAVWVESELWSFGDITTIFPLLKSKIQTSIAEVYKLDLNSFDEIINHLRFARNVSAHHGRLWNYKNKFIANIENIFSLVDFKYQPARSNAKAPNGNSLATTIYIISFMLSIINTNSSWHERMKSLLKNDFPCDYELGIEYCEMGFKKEMKDFELWVDLILKNLKSYTPKQNPV